MKLIYDARLKFLARKIQIYAQKGQTLLEFVLLMGIISTISLLFFTSINSKLADYWLRVVKLILQDPTQQLVFW